MKGANCREGEIMENNIEKIIIGECVNCKTTSKFSYIGTQEGVGDIKSFELYNCLACNFTFSLNSIKGYLKDSEVKI